MKLIPDNLRVEINLRMDSLRRHMREEDADALLVASNPNLYYTTCRFSEDTSTSLLKATRYGL